MKMKLILLVSVIVIAGLACSNTAPKSAAGQATYYTCPMHPSVREDKPGDCPICGMKLVPVQATAQADQAPTNALPACCAPAVAAADQKPLYYTCPMHPSVREDKPGKCPICGMDLVPVYAETNATPAPSCCGAPAVSTTNP